jgi:pyridoxine 4-dehydrogenase
MGTLKDRELTFDLGGDLPVNRLGYGALHLTGPGYWGPPADPDAAIRLLRHAVDLGVTFIDTADSYGPNDNEQLIRKALYPYPEQLVIGTKGGMLRSGPRDWVRDESQPPYIVACGRPEYLRQQVEMSLRNLGVERIDLYELHSIDPTVPLADQLGELVKLRDEGKIRHIGVSGQPGVTLGELTAAREIADIVAVENLYNLGDRGSEEVLLYCEQHGIAFIPFFPLGHGDLAKPSGPLAGLAARRGVTPAQLAIAWLLNHSPNLLLIPGTTSIAHLEENMQARSIHLDSDELTAITDAVDHSGIAMWRPGAV